MPRFHFSLESVTQLHADIGWFIAALAVAVVIGLRFAGGSPRTVRLGWIVLAGLGLQGVIGYAQYFNHLPGRPGMGARLHVGHPLDLRAAAVPVHGDRAARGSPGRQRRVTSGPPASR